MRLSKQEVQAIQTNFKKFFNEGEIYLFGSRVDDKKKGGDIDLYISTSNKENIYEKKLQFLIHLKREIGEQKIDIVIDNHQNRLIDIVAKEEGIRL